jgi:hypothetical protein
MIYQVETIPSPTVPYFSLPNPKKEQAHLESLLTGISFPFAAPGIGRRPLAIFLLTAHAAAGP